MRADTEQWLRSMERIHDDDPPDGWMIRHNRAFGASSIHFGPFATLREAAEWAEAHPNVQGGFIPLYRSVDWNR